METQLAQAQPWETEQVWKYKVESIFFLTCGKLRVASAGGVPNQVVVPVLLGGPLSLFVWAASRQCFWNLRADVVDSRAGCGRNRQIPASGLLSPSLDGHGATLCPSGSKGELRPGRNTCVKLFHEPLSGKSFESRGQHNVFCCTKAPSRELVSVWSGSRGSPGGESPGVPSTERQGGVS